ncbi:MAG: hypothetical protein JWN40_5127 [Phycisphaerales bacterium]|nr:hypothetical protein [Phycisphaerales bacterium]
MGANRPLDYESPRRKRERKAPADWEFWIIVLLPVLVIVVGVIFFSVMILFSRGSLP